MANKCSLQSMLTAVTGVYNIEQNSALPPRIYSSMFNVTTGLLLDKLVKLYPSEQWAVDAIDPFVKQELIAIKDGYINLPTDYRDLLGSPTIFAKQDSSGECTEMPLTASTMANDSNKAKCKQNPIIIVDQAEFAYRTRSSYDFPDYENPIGYFSGKRQIKVCPFDLSKVLVTYCKQEKEYVYGYIMQPDDTYIFDSNTSTESEWGNQAFTPIFNALIALYGSYSREPEMQQWAVILKERGIL